MVIQIKICGLNSRAAADAALGAGADFGGLVLYSASPRHLRLDQAKDFAQLLRGRARIVAVFAGAGDAEMAAAIATVKPDLIQLHGAETPARVAHIRARFHLPVIKAIAIADESDVLAAHDYEDCADYFLFDAKAPAGAAREGGYGAAFDWKLLAAENFRLPWLLAGGLTAANVARAVLLTKARMVDVSSGVEDAPGQKSPDKIKAFVKAARGLLAVDQSQHGAA